MINNWIREKTNNKIEKLFEKEIDSSTQLIIINAIYFRGILNLNKNFSSSFR
jgi:serpin B